MRFNRQNESHSDARRSLEDAGDNYNTADNPVVVVGRLTIEVRPKHGDCLGRFSLGPTIPLPGDCHTARSRDYPTVAVTPLKSTPITCGRGLSRSFITNLEEDLHILAPALVELAVYVGKSGGAR